ncbi:hypothetical protein GCM10007425_04300 [Lysinibacillus alkalisoli]|uniref:Nuclear transport factor 2 family protein n=1 Tax=Lysinibacillus alkalisoli TaxID=1911548 RepID=A0A917FVX2_9BACI|nr:DUF3225 domain-containing protein [Lysinibacillus alkalisoli]GGG13139.1 hypothetical protein GCM10007425_04300 [Lysinibacillus alkalisoli]
MKKWLIALLFVCASVLAACNDSGEDQASTKDTETNKVGFSMDGGSIEEATNVPEDKKEAILNAFNVYIESFNNKEVDQYVDTLSTKSKGFVYKDEQEKVQAEFDAYDTERIAKDITIVKYSEKEAHVFANLEISRTEISTGRAGQAVGRQVTVFVPEDGTWKVSSVHFMSSEGK